MPDINLAERQIIIMQLLSENKRNFTIEEICSFLDRYGIEVNRKTVERDMTNISKNFFVTEGKRDGFDTYSANKFVIDNIAFSYSEIFSLYFTREMLNLYSGMDIGDTAGKIIDKIIMNTPGISKTYLTVFNNMLKVNMFDLSPEISVDNQIVEYIKESISDRETVEIEYTAFNGGETLKRKIDPYLIELSEGRWHVIGHCHLRNACRDFRISRIKNITKLKEKFQKPDGFYETYKKSRFQKLSGEKSELLRIRFSGLAARLVREYEKDKADCITDDTGDSFIFCRNIGLTPEILKWVLGFGAEAEVLEPVELKEAVLENIKSLTMLYKGLQH